MAWSTARFKAWHRRSRFELGAGGGNKGGQQVVSRRILVCFTPVISTTEQPASFIINHHEPLVLDEGLLNPLWREG